MSANIATPDSPAGAGSSPSPLLGRGACLVTYDDQMGLCVPMGWDHECKGALEGGETPVIFPNRAAAQKAIRVSRRWNALRKEQGGSVNSDFDPECVKNVRIVPVISA